MIENSTKNFYIFLKYCWIRKGHQLASRLAFLKKGQYKLLCLIAYTEIGRSMQLISIICLKLLQSIRIHYYGISLRVLCIPNHLHSMNHEAESPLYKIIYGNGKSYDILLFFLLYIHSI